MTLLLLLACAPTDGETGKPPDDTGDTGWTGPCPPEMAQVGDLCIDRYEATLTDDDLGYDDQIGVYPDTETLAVAMSEAGVIPTAPLSWYQARGACLNAGKHLCTVTEWQTACGEASFPWGEEPPAEENCAVPAPDGTTPWTELQPTGSLPECRTPEGVYDQIGNAWEWADPEVLDEAGVPTTAKMGGAFYAGQGNAGCHLEPYRDHAPWFSGTIAARCCLPAR